MKRSSLLWRAPRRTPRGFTLVELLLVLVILTTLAAIVVPKFTNRSQQAKETAAQTVISNLEVALDAFEVDNGFYPRSSEGLGALIQAPSDAKNWRGPYLKKPVTEDPWGNPYVYEYPGKHNSSGYDLMSMGPDGKSGGGDDIVNWVQ
ncbi:MAG: Type II secretion system protein G precursor [candidate division BRC1 bacterium ADurb.BinA364]|nr:MAG: Type II secretion system protein G precursor [candidate division BRC1 bacterium ADurb.BinA364]